MKNRGFISTTFIYTSFVTILLLLVFLLNSYSRVRFLVDEIVYQIKEPDPDPVPEYDPEFKDLNLFVYVSYITSPSEKVLVDYIPQGGFEFDSSSYCTNGSTMEYYKKSDGTMSIKVTSTRQDKCYAYFNELPADIIFTIHIRDNKYSEYYTVNDVPNNNYTYEYTKCTDVNNAAINTTDLQLKFDATTRNFTFNTGQKAYCDAYFVRQPADIILNYFYEDESGDKTYNGKNYKKIDAYNSSYKYSKWSYDCYKFSDDNSTHVTSFTEKGTGKGQFEVLTTGKAECNVYLDR